MAMSRSLGGTLFTTRPLIAISPLVICSSPAIMRSKVDLPQPDGPTKTTKDWSGMSMVTPCRTSVDPNDFRASRMSTDAMFPPRYGSALQIPPMPCLCSR
jgi:hypothetical protein